MPGLPQPAPRETIGGRARCETVMSIVRESHPPNSSLSCRSVFKPLRDCDWSFELQVGTSVALGKSEPDGMYVELTATVLQVDFHFPTGAMANRRSLKSESLTMDPLTPTANKRTEIITTTLTTTERYRQQFPSTGGVRVHGWGGACVEIHNSYSARDRPESVPKLLHTQTSSLDASGSAILKVYYSNRGRRARGSTVDSEE